MRVGALLLLLGCAAAFGGEPYSHPAGAWTLTPPDGWTPRVHFDPNGLAFHVFTPDPGLDPAAYRRGLFVHAMPIQSDRSLTPESLLRFVAATTAMAEPGLKCDPDAARKTTVGGLDARVMDLAGVHHTGGPYRGETLVALQADNVLVVSYGGPPEEWESIRSTVAAVNLTGAAPLVPREGAPRPPQRERSDAVLPRLQLATPLITLLGPRGPLPSYGTGLVVSEDGYVVTARRVLRRIEGRERSDPVQLQFAGGEPILADVVAISRKYDLALLKMRGGAGGANVLPLASEGEVKLAHRALLAGWPDAAQFGSKELTGNEGSVSAIPRDAKGRPIEYRLGARAPTGESGGNAGGPVYDLHLGSVIGVLSFGHVYENAEGTIREVLYESAVPASRILWEFPQVVATPVRALAPEERAALISYYFAQERYGAAMLECARLLEKSPRHGLANAFLYRMLAGLGDMRRAEACFKYTGGKETEYLATLFATDAALERGDSRAAADWAVKTMNLAPMLPQSTWMLARAMALQGGGAAQPAHQVLLMTRDAHPQANALVGALAVQHWLLTWKVVSLFEGRKMADQARLEAEIRLERAIELWPAGQGLAHAYLAILAGAAGDAFRFEEQRTKALDEAGADVEVLLRVAYADLLAKEPFRALEIALPLLQSTDHPGARVIVGWAKAQLAWRAARTSDRAKATRWLAEAKALAGWEANRDAPYPWGQLSRQIFDDGLRQALAPPPGVGGGAPVESACTMELRHGVRWQNQVCVQVYGSVRLQRASGRKLKAIARVWNADGTGIEPRPADWNIGPTIGANSILAPDRDDITYTIRLHFPLNLLWAGKGQRQLKAEFYLAEEDVPITEPQSWAFQVTNR